MTRLTASEIAHALGGRHCGNEFVARCPAHDDHNPSLAIADSADGKVLVYCYAGCPQAAVIAALQSRGLWPSSFWEPPSSRSVAASQAERSIADQRDQANLQHALTLWNEAVAIEGTHAEHYLRSVRGITTKLGSSLRFHVRLKHTPTGQFCPALIALITDAVTAQPIGIHRTFLAPNGQGKARLEPQKMMLGSAKGGVVRLVEASDAVMIGEGIETCLSVQQACGVPTWAALSANGLKTLNLPPRITCVTLLADGDATGVAAAEAAARQLKSTVRTVRIVRAPSSTDFNDLLKGSKQ